MRPETKKILSLTVARLLRQAWLPLLVAIGWSTYKHYHDASPDLLAAFFAAFAFMTYMQGQYYRAEKQVVDGENFDKVFTTMDDLKQSIRDLAARESHRDAPSPRSSPASPASKRDAVGPENERRSAPGPAEITLPITEAEKAMAQGFIVPGLLMAATVFDQAAQRAAQRLQFEAPYGRSPYPTGQFLGYLRQQAGYEKAAADLLAVWRTRNALVHADQGQVVHFLDKDRAEAALRGFRWGTEYLDGISPPTAK